MYIIIAPSKTMTMTRPFPRAIPVTTPYFSDDATRIVDAVRHTIDIAQVMHVSEPIAGKVVAMYEKWGSEKAPSAFAYVGDVYKGFFAETLSVEDLRWAQQRMFILSGLYGALRPMDEISPYRLEMRAKLQVQSASSIYEFWGEKVARMIDKQSGNTICNLSSDEYAKVVTKYTKKRIVTPLFIDEKSNGTVGPVPIYGKMMRGVLARWIIDNRVETPEGLQRFASQGYSFDEARSTANQPTFYRSHPKPIRFQ
jgi:cytoplasmic iron level regulating protein YaaA (DUF328/UPF0246 family)